MLLCSPPLHATAEPQQQQQCATANNYQAAPQAPAQPPLCSAALLYVCFSQSLCATRFIAIRAAAALLQRPTAALCVLQSGPYGADRATCLLTAGKQAHCSRAPLLRWTCLLEASVLLCLFNPLPCRTKSEHTAAEARLLRCVCFTSLLLCLNPGLTPSRKAGALLRAPLLRCACLNQSFCAALIVQPASLPAGKAGALLLRRPTAALRHKAQACWSKPARKQPHCCRGRLLRCACLNQTFCAALPASQLHCQQGSSHTAAEAHSCCAPCGAAPGHAAPV